MYQSLILSMALHLSTAASDSDVLLFHRLPCMSVKFQKLNNRKLYKIEREKVRKLKARNLNSGAVEIEMYVLKTNDIMINILADLKPRMRGMMRLDTVSTYLKFTLHTVHILLVLPQLFVFAACSEELTIQKPSNPILFFLFLYNKFASNLSIQQSINS